MSRSILLQPDANVNLFPTLPLSKGAHVNLVHCKFWEYSILDPKNKMLVIRIWQICTLQMFESMSLVNAIDPADFPQRDLGNSRSVM